MAEFIPDYVVRDGQVYTRSTQVENPAAHLLVDSKISNKVVNVWLPAIEGFEENANSPYQFEAKDLKMGYFTGLQVSHEPGQWAVWAGVLLMGLGLAVVFYLVHMRFWIVPVRNAQGQLAALGRRRGQQKQRCVRAEVSAADYGNRIPESKPAETCAPAHCPPRWSRNSSAMEDALWLVQE